jgi:hypothetical protein
VAVQPSRWDAGMVGHRAIDTHAEMFVWASESDPGCWSPVSVIMNRPLGYPPCEEQIKQGVDWCQNLLDHASEFDSPWVYFDVEPMITGRPQGGFRLSSVDCVDGRILRSEMGKLSTDIVFQPLRPLERDSRGTA